MINKHIEHLEQNTSNLEQSNSNLEQSNSNLEQSNSNLERSNSSKCKINLECKTNILELDKNICIVDLSYMTFTRFFAVRKWYEIKSAKEKPDWKIPDTHDWMNDIEFMDKYNKLFFEKLFHLCYKQKIPRHNIIFVSDCKHKDNWRVVSKASYKCTRKDSHDKNKFYNFNIFPYVRDNLIKELQEEGRNIVLHHSNLEADDVIACLVKYINNKKKYNKSITIITTDKDYFQLCNSKVACYDLSGKCVSSKVLTEFVNAKEYLLYKVLLGDVSDNIPACYLSKEFLATANYITKKPYLKASKGLITKLFLNNSCKQLLLEYLNYVYDINISKLTEDELKYKWLEKYDIFDYITKDKQFESNAKFIDFNNIPVNYVNDIDTLLSQLIIT